MTEQIGNVTLHLGDCLDVMAGIPDGSVDMVLCDLPYGVTACKWDSVIPLEPLWAHYKRVIKPNGAIALTAAQPFTSALVMSNPSWFRHEWIWDKGRGAGFLNAKKAPLKSHETVLVFSEKATAYNPQMRPGAAYRRTPDRRPSDNYNDERPTDVRVYSGGRYPLTIVPFPRDSPRIHPTQKPVALFAYLIRTYTTPGDVVLDSCAGSGTTGVACQQEGRRAILIERDHDYYANMRERLKAATQDPESEAVA